MKFTRLLKVSFSSIISNKTRSFLTMLGIIIGISSVIVLVGIGQGTKEKITSQIEKLGTNLITVNINAPKVNKVTNEELNELKTKPGIKDIAPFMNGSVTIKGGDTSSTTSLQATTPNYTSIRNINVAQGRFLNQDDIDNRYDIAVIGPEAATNVFNSTDVVGQNIYINGIKFSIVGVLATQGSSAMGSSDDVIMIPISTAQRLLKDSSIKTFYIQAENKDKVNDAMAYLQMFLNKKYNGNTNYYRIFNQSSLLDTANASSDSLTMMLGGIALISLLVGGIGIMNIMLVSVIERTREIGIRKAIGAKRKTILSQFLIEASTLSGLGGILGVIVAYILSYFVKNTLKMAVSISPNIVIASFTFSVLVGIIFGIYPAMKASKLNPIEALRYE